MTTQTASAATDYEYHLPDHWVDHELRAEDPFVKQHGYYVGRVVDIFREAGAKTVLEPGCGDAWVVGQMVAAGIDVVGVDWSPNAIAYGRVLVPGAKFHHGDVRDPEFIRQFPDKFDGVAMVEVIEHIPPDDCVDAIANITSRLREGGTLVMTTPHVNVPNTNPQHYRHFTPELLKQIVESVAGLEVVGVEGYGDVKAERSYYKKMRLADNKLFRIKPLARRLEKGFVATPGPLSQSAGLILIAKKSG